MTEPVQDPPVVTPPAPKPVTRVVPALEEPEDRQTAYSPQYIKDLREENKGWRLKASEQESLRKEADAKAEKAAKDAEDALKVEREKLTAEKAEIETSSQKRIIQAELRAEAIKAGMVDLDGLKLADLSAVKIDEKGEVVGAEALMAALKESKPYLFGKPVVGTSNPQTPPKPTPPNGKPALAMSQEEWAAKLRDIDAGKRIAS